MRVIIFIDDDTLGRIEPLLFRDIPAMLRHFREVRGENFPDDEEGRECLRCLEAGGDYAYAAYYMGWHEVFE